LNLETHAVNYLETTILGRKYSLELTLTPALSLFGKGEGETLSSLERVTVE
jgi:hypothetical protein